MAVPIEILDKYILFFLTIPMSSITELLQKMLIFKSSTLSMDKISDALDLTDKIYADTNRDSAGAGLAGQISNEYYITQEKLIGSGLMNYFHEMTTKYWKTVLTNGNMWQYCDKKFEHGPHGFDYACKIIGGAGDNAAAAAGMGIINQKQSFISLGTSGVFFTPTQNFLSNTGDAVHSFCHCLPNKWHLMSVMLSASNCLDWICSITNTSISCLLYTSPSPRD